MKLAIAGKGGSGKTTVAATVARLAARRGVEVLAIDADFNPNLAFTLGVSQDAFAKVTALPPDVVRRRGRGMEATLELARPVDELVHQFGFDCPDGVRLLLMGRPEKAGTGCLCLEHETVRSLLRELPPDQRLVLLDMEASPEHLSRATPEAADVMLVVAEPYFRSLETARRQAALAEDLGIARVAVVANKIRTPDDSRAVESFCEGHGIHVEATVPYDERLGEAERVGAAPIDHAADAPAVMAIAELVDGLLSPAR